MAIITPSSK
jgi:hypothetical protein